MPVKEHKEQPQTNPERSDRPKLDAIVSKQVINSLGQPGGLCMVQVRRLWEEHYRVNVFVGAASGRVAHSYFLVTDEAGNIIASTPKIIRQY